MSQGLWSTRSGGKERTLSSRRSLALFSAACSDVDRIYLFSLKLLPWPRRNVTGYTCPSSAAMAGQYLGSQRLPGIAADASRIALSRHSTGILYFAFLAKDQYTPIRLRSRSS